MGQEMHGGESSTRELDSRRAGEWIGRCCRSGGKSSPLIRPPLDNASALNAKEENRPLRWRRRQRRREGPDDASCKQRRSWTARVCFPSSGLLCFLAAWPFARYLDLTLLYAVCTVPYFGAPRIPDAATRVCTRCSVQCRFIQLSEHAAQRAFSAWSWAISIPLHMLDLAWVPRLTE